MTRTVRVHHGVPYTDIFHRTLSEDHTQIVSRCELCGEVLIGSVSQGLPRREVEHFLTCRKKQAAKPAAAA
jgi:hypothetical protein